MVYTHIFQRCNGKGLKSELLSSAYPGPTEHASTLYSDVLISLGPRRRSSAFLLVQY